MFWPKSIRWLLFETKGKSIKLKTHTEPYLDCNENAQTEEAQSCIAGPDIRIVAQQEAAAAQQARFRYAGSWTGRSAGRGGGDDAQQVEGGVAAQDHHGWSDEGGSCGRGQVAVHHSCKQRVAVHNSCKQRELYTTPVRCTYIEGCCTPGMDT